MESSNNDLSSIPINQQLMEYFQHIYEYLNDQAPQLLQICSQDCSQIPELQNFNHDNNNYALLALMNYSIRNNKSMKKYDCYWTSTQQSTTNLVNGEADFYQFDQVVITYSLPIFEVYLVVYHKSYQTPVSTFPAQFLLGLQTIYHLLTNHQSGTGFNQPSLATEWFELLSVEPIFNTLSAYISLEDGWQWPKLQNKYWPGHLEWKYKILVAPTSEINEGENHRSFAIDIVNLELVNVFLDQREQEKQIIRSKTGQGTVPSNSGEYSILLPPQMSNCSEFADKLNNYTPSVGMCRPKPRKINCPNQLLTPLSQKQLCPKFTFSYKRYEISASSPRRYEILEPTFLLRNVG